MKNDNHVEAPVRFGTNLGLMLEMYDNYVNDPESVPEDLQVLFDELTSNNTGAGLQSSTGVDNSSVKRVMRLIDNIRQYGHLTADIYPVYRPERKNVPKLTHQDFGLSKETLEKLPAVIVSDHFDGEFNNAYEAIEYMTSCYQGPIAFEYTHINNNEERVWLKRYIESTHTIEISKEEKIELLKSLAEVEGFEKYIHKNFVGAKRFSIEGVDTLVPMLQRVLKRTNAANIPNIQIGMAHRGRLNVLTHVLEKPYEMMISEFMHKNPLIFLPKDGSLEITAGWTGDVKYHLGGTKTTSKYGIEQSITLANNPSHLEIVSPVVLGKARANQDTTVDAGRPSQDVNKSLAILIHGDAAFPGQGINFESMNLSNLDGYTTGGSLHIITNNRIGFTTEAEDGRSTTYSTDVAKGYDLPIIHVNADDVEATVKAIEMAMDFREKFNKDFVIDLVGYRRYGHNEMDEPSITNPMMYKAIKEHPSIEHIYGKQLVEEGIITEDEMNGIFDDVTKRLRAAHDKIDKDAEMDNPEMTLPDNISEGQDYELANATYEELKAINDAMFDYPEDFTVFKKLNKVLDRRREPFEKDGLVDWAHAEQLAFATILQNGTPIRLTGQDSERGTFAHRHAVLHDEKDGKLFIPLHHVPNGKASFDIHNSPLSEAAVVGFEYGYNVDHPQSFNIWEAQYGDFANMAQMIFDNFLSNSNAKWGEKSGLALFLPHSNEGQGPEHSSARLERFLQLAGENNMTIANLTSASNYYHLLRRHAKYLNTDKMRPLVLMSPKSLLRNKIVSRAIEEFTKGQFEPILVEPYKKTKVKKVIISSGKMFIDLKTELQKNPNDELCLIALEQLYPFPKEEIKNVLSEFRNLETVRWVQEEAKNQGAWSFVSLKLQNILEDRKVELEYHGRKVRSSTAEGDGEIYKLIQSKVIQEALKHN
ncbi:2-oxoglutarate dehydrogenase E1 component [Mammaliicoccus sciuri]|uniref:2-oxoglutarate dehydrogenase E1 component n=1 Tax=Mammaliicoccus sciuri TaxID=1296 RepID=UPI002DBD77A8|nr:2-oxoglutarate dehydrogenase E1 component [Mammaliicoccus sciuri]MEB7438359.1 2-oxoglutarate dehydrogenase E1 component [Mammaliicoccus sciuri]MEB8296251.1 2-oxoglutarate dehydrogenase E1 component [Mammaliicoccus sciuri]